MTHSYVTRLNHMRHDSPTGDLSHSWATWLTHIWHDSLLFDTTHSLLTCLTHMWHDAFICDMTHIWFICDMTHITHIWHEPHICNMANSYATCHLTHLYTSVTRLTYTWHTSHTSVTWLTYTWHEWDSLIRHTGSPHVTYEPHICNTTHSYATCHPTHEPHICNTTHSHTSVTRLIHTRNVSLIRSHRPLPQPTHQLCSSALCVAYLALHVHIVHACKCLVRGTRYMVCDINYACIYVCTTYYCKC